MKKRLMTPYTEMPLWQFSINKYIAKSYLLNDNLPLLSKIRNISKTNVLGFRCELLTSKLFGWNLNVTFEGDIENK